MRTVERQEGRRHALVDDADREHVDEPRSFAVAGRSCRGVAARDRMKAALPSRKSGLKPSAPVPAQGLVPVAGIAKALFLRPVALRAGGIGRRRADDDRNRRAVAIASETASLRPASDHDALDSGEVSLRLAVDEAQLRREREHLAALAGADLDDQPAARREEAERRPERSPDRRRARRSRRRAPGADRSRAPRARGPRCRRNGYRAGSRR